MQENESNQAFELVHTVETEHTKPLNVRLWTANLGGSYRSAKAIEKILHGINGHDWHEDDTGKASQDVPTILMLQELPAVIKETGQNISEYLTELLDPLGWKFSYQASPDEEKQNLGMAFVMSKGVRMLSHEDRDVFTHRLPTSKMPKAFEKIVPPRIREAHVGMFTIEETGMSVAVANCHTDVIGGKDHRVNQISVVREELDTFVNKFPDVSCVMQVIGGDFNTAGMIGSKKHAQEVAALEQALCIREDGKGEYMEVTDPKTPSSNVFSSTRHALIEHAAHLPFVHPESEQAQRLRAWMNEGSGRRQLRNFWRENILSLGHQVRDRIYVHMRMNVEGLVEQPTRIGRIGDIAHSDHKPSGAWLRGSIVLSKND